MNELFKTGKRPKRKVSRSTVEDSDPLIVSFSGGRTSAYMLRILLDRGEPIAKVLFCNTGKERDETLDFVHEIEARWSVPITWLEYTRRDNEHAWRQVSYETAHRTSQPNSPFDAMLSWAGALPNVRGRSCSAELKIRTMRRYLESVGVARWRDAIGIRWDESARAIGICATKPSFIRPEFPLISAGIAESDVMEFWKAQPFDLQLRQDEGNCDGCFLKSKAKLVRIEQERPGTLDWWREQEEAKAIEIGAGNGACFRTDRTFAEVQAIARGNLGQSMLFNDDGIACNCMEAT